MRNREYKKLCQTRKTDLNADDSKFNMANEKFVSQSRDEYEKYINEIGSSFKSDPKRFWSFVNNKRKSNGLPCKLTLEAKEATSDGDKANLLADFFSSVYTAHPRDDSFESKIQSRDDRGCWNIKISADMVQIALDSMDLNKGNGPDKMPPLFVRRCSEQLSIPLSDF